MADRFFVSRRGFIAVGGAVTLTGFARGQDRGSRSAEADAGDWIQHSELPNNREPPLPQLVESWLTPVDRFYVRSHAAAPEIDPAVYRLQVDGLVDRPLNLSLEQLRREFPQVEVTATLTCAGNRRYEHSRIRKIDGVPWREGAVGNARWGGVRLSDVLSAAGVKSEARHVWFDGLDRIQRSTGEVNFGSSIPIGKAGDEGGKPGAIICTSMNGMPLSSDHGFPVRAVVPGYIGARSVKWLGRIHVSDRESPNHYQQNDYKLVGSDDPLESAEASPIYRFPINAVICVPAPGAAVDPARGPLRLAGYALPPGRPGVVVDRVELSVDGGNTWRPTQLGEQSQSMCWRFWEAELEIPPGTAELTVRAIASDGTVQPAAADWNFKGYLFNARHRVPIAASLP